MYQELSNQFLYTKEKFENTKSKDLLKISCPCCTLIFEFTKQKIQTNWRRSASKVLYCSYECSTKVKKSKTVNEVVNCLHCNKEFERNISNKKSKDKKFCNSTCCATYMNKNRTEQERLEINTKVSLKLKGKYLKKI